MKFGIDFELDLKKAEKQVEAFIAETQKKMNAKLRTPAIEVPADVRSKFQGITPSAYADIIAATKTQRLYKAGGFDRNLQTGQAFRRKQDEIKILTNPAYKGLSNVDTVKTFLARKEASSQRAALYGMVGVENARQFMDSHTGSINWKAVAQFGSEQAKAAKSAQDLNEQLAEQAKNITEIEKAVKRTTLFGSGASGGLIGRLSGTSPAGDVRGRRGSLMGAENYDGRNFSVRKLLRSFGVVAAGYLSLRGAHGIGQNLFGAGTDREASMFQNSIAFGSRGVADEAYMSALRSGMPFEASDMMSGMRTLQERGVSGRGSMRMVSGMAGRLGQSYSETAQDIAAAIGGDSQVLLKYGLKQSDLAGLRHLQGNTPRMRSAVMGLLNRGDIKKQFENGLLDFQATWEGTMKRLANQRKDVWSAVIGDPKDPSSLYGAFKNTFVKLSNWIQTNQESIRRFATSVGKVLTWMWGKIDAVATRVSKVFKGLLDTFWSTDKQFERFTKRLLLGLEITWQKLSWFAENFPFTTIATFLAGGAFINSIMTAGQLSGGAFAKGFLRGLVGVLSARELAHYITRAFYGEDFETAAMSAARGNITSAFEARVGQAGDVGDWLSNFDATPQDKAKRYLREKKVPKGEEAAYFNYAYGTNYDWSKMQQPIVINLNNPVMTNDTVSMFSNAILGEIAKQNKKKGN